MRGILVKAMSCVLLFLFCVAFTGCDENVDIYERAAAYEKAQEQKIKEMSEKTYSAVGNSAQSAEEALDEVVAGGTKYISKSLNRVGWIVIFVSLLIGGVMTYICSHTAAIRLYRASILIFLIGIPLLMLLLMYGLAFLSSWFM